MNNNTKCDLALRIRPLKAALQISFRDIQFISAYHDKILLPYTGDLPQVIQQYIINDALETCYTVKEMLKTVENRMESMGIHLDANEEAVKELARVGFDPKYGARPLRRAIQSKVEDAVAEKMLDGTLDTGDTAKLTVEDGKLVVTK